MGGREERREGTIGYLKFKTNKIKVQFEKKTKKKYNS